MGSRVLGLLIGASILGGCAHSSGHWPGNAVLCKLAKERRAGRDIWVKAILHGYDPTSHRVTQPAVDCTGAQVRWEGPALSCSDSISDRTPLPERPLVPDDVVVVPVSENVQMVWVMTTHFATGDALGPLAVVESLSDSLVVRAIGPLRANPQQVKLRLEQIGDMKVAVAEGDQCAGPDPSSCQRTARLVPLRGNRFMPEPFLSEEGACLGPALLDLSRQAWIALEPGRQRRIKLEAALLFGTSGLTIQEQVAIYDSDARQPSAPPRIFHQAESDRYVRSIKSRLATSGSPLWGRMMEASLPKLE